MMKLIDIDDPTSWPAHIYSIVAEWANECAGKTKYTNDLPLRHELEAPFRERLKGHLLRAYHYTRLLPHERQMVGTHGLRMLSADLLAERIHAAHVANAISDVEAEIFHKTHVFAVGEEKYREGQICLVLSGRLYERDPDACLPLLSSWGGEGLYRSSGSVPFRSRLTQLGTPARVVALVALEDSQKHAVYPALHKVFVASLLELNDVGANVFYRSPIPPEHVERIEEVLPSTY
jgi:hypothetical protein